MVFEGLGRRMDDQLMTADLLQWQERVREAAAYGVPMELYLLPPSRGGGHMAIETFGDPEAKPPVQPDRSRAAAAVIQQYQAGILR